MTTSPRLLTRVATRVIGWYPQSWRQRYESELLALLEDSPPQIHDVAVFARGLVVQHGRALLQAADRASRDLTVVARLQPILLLLAVAVTVGAGRLLDRWQPAPATLIPIAQVSLLVVMLTVIVAQSWLRRRRRRVPDIRGVAFPAKAGVIAVPMALLVIVFVEWTCGDRKAGRGDYWISRYVDCFFYWFSLRFLSSGAWPGRPLLEAVNELEAAEVQLRAAAKWAAACRDSAANGDLADAEAEVARWTADRERALALAEQLGYRARFRRESTS